MSPEDADRQLQDARARIREQLQAEPLPPLRDRAEPDTQVRLTAADGPEPDVVGEPERQARQARLDVTEHLQAANAGAAITGPIQIASRVPVIGPVLTLLRRLARPFVQPFIDPYLDRQERFNADVVRHLNELGNRLEIRLEHIERLADPARAEARVVSVLERYDQALRQRHTVLFDALEEELVALQNLVNDRSVASQRRAEEFAGRLDRVDGGMTSFEIRYTERAQAVDARFEEKDAFLAEALEQRDRQLEQVRAALDQTELIDQAELLSTRAALGRTLEEVGRQRHDPGGRPGAEVEAWSRLRDWMGDADYQAFQDRFRGDAAEITGRMRAHVEHFRGAPGPVADLGCGRGEFLGLLAEAGVQAIGVETNEADVESCMVAGLDAAHADLFDWLAAREPGSLGGIFMAQVIEHLRPRDWSRVVELASTRIAAGGRLVIETVNPLSLYAFTRAYVIDPTHTRPVHPDLLAYLAERQGFWPVEIRYQAEVPPESRVKMINPAVLEDNDAARQLIRRLNEQLVNLDTLCFAPQEYALVAVKPPKR